MQIIKLNFLSLLWGLNRIILLNASVEFGTHKLYSIPIPFYFQCLMEMQTILSTLYLKFPQVLLCLLSHLSSRVPLWYSSDSDISLKCYMKAMYAKFSRTFSVSMLLLPRDSCASFLYSHFTYSAWLMENKLGKITIEFITSLVLYSVFSPNE